MQGGGQEWSAGTKALGDAIAALTVREAVQLALYIKAKLSGNEDVATPQNIDSHEIALGLTDHLAEFRNAVAPEAAIYTEWHELGLTSLKQFDIGFYEVVRKANAIHFNIQGIHDVADAAQAGQRGYDRPPAEFPSNYTNFELFALSLLAAHGNGIQSADQFRAKMRWYNGAKQLEQPAGFLAKWAGH